MRYVVRTFLAMFLFAFCWATLAYSIYQLLQVGTCASGGPYEIARECPSGIERVTLMIPAAVLLLFVAAGIYTGRGSPPGSARGPNHAWVVIWFWTGLFWSLAVGSFLAIWGPDQHPAPDAKLGGLIVGFMGLVMGAGGLLALKFGRVFGGESSSESEWGDPERVRPVVTRVAETASRFSGRAHSLDRLEQLESMRDRGTLSNAEFETLKKRIVEGRD